MIVTVSLYQSLKFAQWIRILSLYIKETSYILLSVIKYIWDNLSLLKRAYWNYVIENTAFVVVQAHTKMTYYVLKQDLTTFTYLGV